MYSAVKALEEYKRGDDITPINDVLSEKLRWTFQVDKLGDMVSKTAEESLDFRMKMDKMSFNYQFSKSAASKVGAVEPVMNGKEGNSIFIPAKEVLSLFAVILKSREIDKSFGFDDTYYDLAKALRIVPSRGKNYAVFANSRKVVSNVIDGKVDYDENSGKWYYKNQKNQKFSIGATSEGVKKIAIMDRLLANGYLNGNSMIFIDEIESALNSLNLYAKILLNRYSQEGVSEAMRNVEELEIRLILIVKNAKKTWIAPLQDVFRKELKAEMRIWKVTDFFILNEEMARKKHFIV